MNIKEQLVRAANIKIMQTLDQAGIDHKVIAAFMSCEGIPAQAHEISTILNQYDALGSKKLPSKKVRALLTAKQLGEEDESLPCPAAY
ncbi:hypothetical protein [Acinetobacter zhairhuonensis]|uniref:hypothetical protein n=1 Tax=Acinetobacter sp. A7.4 TaxID=2919921 RepID=UPI001F4F38CF|nr:hypothetical protein [Acinetobacter sp. A7.4]MCJ8161834.1 hypothetical protein [Acinetobacter sp. A7.4]